MTSLYHVLPKPLETRYYMIRYYRNHWVLVPTPNLR